MKHDGFSHVKTWVFDLDNTLYHPSVRLFDQIERRMTDWVSSRLGVSRDEADRLRHIYWRDYGTTLAGLMEVHGADPHEYLVEVHRIDFSALEPNPLLQRRIRALPGRRIVYTNGPAPYAREVLKARGLETAFDAVYGVEDAGFEPKPRRAAFDAIMRRDGCDATSASMFEDDARNLEQPHQMGMRTVHVAPVAAPAEHIHHHTPDLSDFLRGCC